MLDIICTLKNIDDIDLLNRAGCNHIVVGDEVFSMRQTHRFSLDEIKQIVQIAKNKNMQCSALVNAFYDDDKKEDLTIYLKYLVSIDINTIYYHDPMVFMIMEDLNALSKLVYDPTTLMSNALDMKLYQDLGINHVSISPQITLDEIKDIYHTYSEGEVTIFGYTNMSYSKRRLITNYLEEINSNETLHNKEDLYLIESTRNGKMPVVEDDFGTQVYTDYILLGINEFRQLVDLGYKHFMFDTIFLNIDLVCDALKAYLDFENNPKVLEENIKNKYQLLNFDSGYMDKKTNLVK